MMLPPVTQQGSIFKICAVFRLYQQCKALKQQTSKPVHEYVEFECDILLCIVAFVLDSIAVQLNSFWIGLHCRRTNNYFEWLSEDPVLYTNWDRREPNAYTPDENCVEVYPVCLTMAYTILPSSKACSNFVIDYVRTAVMTRSA